MEKIKNIIFVNDNFYTICRERQRNKVLNFATSKFNSRQKAEMWLDHDNPKIGNRAECMFGIYKGYCNVVYAIVNESHEWEITHDKESEQSNKTGFSMNNIDDLYPKDKPWPTSIFKRMYPGIGVTGRKWNNITALNLKVIIGDILRDSQSTVGTVDIDINIETGLIISAQLESLNNAIITIDAKHQESFEEFIKISATSKISMIRVSFHSLGWFWGSKNGTS